MGHYYPDPALGPLARMARKAPYLSREEEYDLLKRWLEKQDHRALDKLSLAHTRLVIAQSLRFKSYGLPLSDLIQEGHIGLMEAANRFDLSKEVRFSTYATWWIKASIQDYILRNHSIIRGGTSSRQKNLFFSFKRIRAELANKQPDWGEEQLNQEIAARTGANLRDVLFMSARLNRADTSLHAPIRDSESTLELQDRIACDEPQPDEIVERSLDSQQSSRQLQCALNTLLPREQVVIKKRRLSEKTVTLEALGKTLGVSKERVRQIEARALEKLKAAMVPSEEATDLSP